MKPIAIQGIKGSFHHEVAVARFGDAVNVAECTTFDEVVRQVVSGESGAGLMAIENSIAGALLPNYALIDRHGLHITAEHYLDITQNLMALPGQSIDRLTQVRSHPMALLQCLDFLQAHPAIVRVEDDDTAGAAQQISVGKMEQVGAIGSALAAKLYGLEILAPAIQNTSNNITRFVQVEVAPHTAQSFDKASLKFELPHVRGSLASVLSAMADSGWNLTKIQSLPKPETPWKYAFFADVTFADPTEFTNTLFKIQPMTDALTVIGQYPNAQP